MNHDTIAAQASGIGNAAIGVIRVSGDDAFDIVGHIFCGADKKGVPLASLPSHTAKHGFLTDGEQIIDEVLLIVFKGPHSYTGEDSVEIDCHGGRFVMQQILSALVRAGARLAEPGEFSRRAFLNGKMDLSQAEAVMDLIGAEHEMARKSAMRQLKGSLGNRIRAMRQTLLYHTAYIESALDDPEHISLDGYPEELKAALAPLLAEVEALLASAKKGRYIREGVRVVLAGKPNVGKSSLLNALLEEERAIVTEIPGTTRDSLSEKVMLGALPVRLTDTAGIRESGDAVEKIGVDLAKKALADADLVLFVLDGSAPADERDAAVANEIASKEMFVVLNKTDCPVVTGEAEVRRLFAGRETPPILRVSAKSGLGIKELESSLEEQFLSDEGKSALSEEEYITNLRHVEVLEAVRRYLRQVVESIGRGLPEDFFTIDLMAACEELGTLTGETAREDLIDEIFRKFCTGK